VRIFWTVTALSFLSFIKTNNTVFSILPSLHYFII
jgi:hypothetical protein